MVSGSGARPRRLVWSSKYMLILIALKEITFKHNHFIKK
jgi:hypothetical protein